MCTHALDYLHILYLEIIHSNFLNATKDYISHFLQFSSPGHSQPFNFTCSVIIINELGVVSGQGHIIILPS